MFDKLNFISELTQEIKEAGNDEAVEHAIKEKYKDLIDRIETLSSKVKGKDDEIQELYSIIRELKDKLND